jgi:hypothetical protein
MMRWQYMRGFGTAFALSSMLFGCGESGQAIRDNGQCPEQGLYKYLDGDGGNSLSAWAARRRHPDGTPFSAADELTLEKTIGTATSDTPQGGRCLTPAGHADSLDAGN